ncbi:MAG: (2Fe-2S)-binding protein [Bacteroidota bacterium]
MEEKYICTCMEITHLELETMILKQNLTTLEEIQEKTEAGTVCGTCIDDITELLNRIQSKK